MTNQSAPFAKNTKFFNFKERQPVVVSPSALMLLGRDPEDDPLVELCFGKQHCSPFFYYLGRLEFFLRIYVEEKNLCLEDITPIMAMAKDHGLPPTSDFARAIVQETYTAYRLPGAPQEFLDRFGQISATIEATNYLLLDASKVEIGTAASHEMAQLLLRSATEKGLISLKPANRLLYEVNADKNLAKTETGVKALIRKATSNKCSATLSKMQERLEEPIVSEHGTVEDGTEAVAPTGSGE